MIDFKINSTTYKIKTRWQEITWSQYCELVVADSIEKKLEVCTGIPNELIKEIPFESLSMICSLIQFIDTHEELHLISKPYTAEISVAMESYGKLERSKLAINNAENPMQSGAKVVEIYTGEKINDKPVTEVFNMVTFFLSK
jgi:hypothetical protein